MKDDDLRSLFHIIFNRIMGYCMVLWAGGCNYERLYLRILFLFFFL